MDFETILLKKQEGVGTIVLNRPRALNPLSYKAGVEISAAVEDLKRDDQVRAVIITGAGTAFSAGGDIREIEKAPPQEGVKFREFMLVVKKVIVDNINFFPKNEFMAVVKNLLAQGIDVYVNGLIYDYRKREYGATKSLMKIADECIEQFSICVRCGGKAEHTERVAGPTDQSIGTTGKVTAKYIAVCSAHHKIYRG